MKPRDIILMLIMIFAAILFVFMRDVTVKTPPSANADMPLPLGFIVVRCEFDGPVHLWDRVVVSDKPGLCHAEPLPTNGRVLGVVVGEGMMLITGGVGELNLQYR